MKAAKKQKRGKEKFHGPGTSTAKFYPAANKWSSLRISKKNSIQHIVCANDKGLHRACESGKLEVNTHRACESGKYFVPCGLTKVLIELERKPPTSSSHLGNIQDIYKLSEVDCWDACYYYSYAGACYEYSWLRLSFIFSFLKRFKTHNCKSLSSEQSRLGGSGSKNIKQPLHNTTKRTLRKLFLSIQTCCSMDDFLLLCKWPAVWM